MSPAIHNRHEDTQQYIDDLDRESAAVWSEILSKSRLVEAIEKRTIDRKLFAIYMIETYHYTLHNARNQALVGVRAMDQPPQYIKFCFTHAAEETGHELMALHDAKKLGLKDVDFDIPPPLPDTEALIAYLYWISATGNPLQRLGYSYWAENSYHYINPLVHKLKEHLHLEDNQLTFFIAHSEIDDEHAREVQEMLRRHCRSASDWAAVKRVLATSLRLTGRFMEGVYEEYERLRAGQSTGYSFLAQHL